MALNLGLVKDQEFYFSGPAVIAKINHYENHFNHLSDFYCNIIPGF